MQFGLQQATLRETSQQLLSDKSKQYQCFPRLRFYLEVSRVKITKFKFEMLVYNRNFASWDTRTNDLANGVNTMKKVRKQVKVVREIDESEKINIGFSSVIYHKDKDFEDERNEVNMKLKKYYEVKGFVLIENANIDESACITVNCIKIKTLLNQF